MRTDTGTGRSGPLRGIIPPMVTPLTGPDTLDHAGLERLIERLIDGGVHGIFILGTTGEGPSLGYRLRREVIARTCRQVGGRVPVLAGITDTSFVESVSMAEFAADSGCFAVVSAPPFYFHAGQPELLEFLEHLTARLTVPLYLYNAPGLTKIAFKPESVEQAITLPGIAGIKDSSGDLEYFQRIRDIISNRDDLSLLMGPEELLVDALTLGGDGGVSGGANVRPDIFVSLYTAFVAGDMERVRELNMLIATLDEIYQVGHYGSAVIKGIKCALSILGVCDDFTADPFHRFRDPERQRVARILDDLRDME